MKRLLVLCAILAVWGLSSIAQSESHVPQPTLTGLIENAATAGQDPNFTIFYAALQAADYDTLLDTIGPLTLMAPTDSAFETYFEQQGITRADLLQDTERLKPLLLYHMLPGNFMLENLHDYPGEAIATAYAGTTVTFRFEKNSLVRLGYVNRSSILAGDASARNGTIHVISDVLIPPDDGGSLDNLLLLQQTDTRLLETMETNGGHDTFLNVLENARLPYQYMTSGLPVTILAPHDSGFQKYLDDQRTDLAAYLGRNHYLTRQMAYHIVPLPFTRENLLQLDGARIGTYLNGEALTVRIDDETVFIDDARIIQLEHITGNGVQHTLEQPLVISDGHENDTDMKPVLPLWVRDTYSPGDSLFRTGKSVADMFSG